MYPRARLEALSDAIFGVSMTLLVLDLRLPEDFHPADGRALLDAFFQMASKFIPVLSFLVLGLRWGSGARLRTAEDFEPGYFRWWLLYQLTIYPTSQLISLRNLRF
jgi:TMEM175 potassium channel family protein